MVVSGSGFGLFHDIVLLEFHSESQQAGHDRMGFSVLIAAFFLLGPVWPTPKLDDNASGRMDPFPIEEFKTVRLRVEGMACEACVNRLRRTLMRMEGVYDASVDLEKKLAEVRYDTGRTDPGKIRERITDVGFSSASADASSTENEEDEEKMP